ncbi:polysaccharide biosynthesis/export family protein (plasmid) [Salipiger sp. H15]|uniref:Polysaccharide biosynthesis/export family protein n=1 Tax=Alloyangia sp. H15 TaxID=3029062 RepID=A0AAU8ATM9_9RHOB
MAGFISTAKQARAAAVALLLIMLTAACPALAQQAEPYRVTTGDRLSVSVYGNPDQSGELRLDADGAIVHPLAGTVPALGRTLEEIRGDLSARLAEFLPNPTVTIGIAAYSPVFVLGDVQSPGEYDYRPGLSVLQLIALAGGVPRDPLGLTGGFLSILDAKRDAEMQSLAIFAAEVTIARLQSELSDESFVTTGITPPPLISRSDENRIIDDEHQLYALRKEKRAAQDRGFEAQIQSYDTEIETLEKSIVLHNDELALMEEDISATQQLVERSLATPTRLREVQREKSAKLRDALELQMYLSRARQGKVATTRERTDAGTEFRTAVGESLKAARADLVQAQLRLRTIEETLANLRSSRELAADGGAESDLVLTVMRASGDELQELPITANARLAPGDILRVTRPAFAAGATN